MPSNMTIGDNKLHINALLQNLRSQNLQFDNARRFSWHMNNFITKNVGQVILKH